MAKEKSSVSHKVFTAIGIVLCVILIPILVVNITLIIKSKTDKDKVPGIGGVIPLIVLTESMNPVIKGGDLVICRSIAPEDVKAEDIIAFFDPADLNTSDGRSVVTHRVKEIIRDEKTGELFFRTKGDNNNIEDRVLVPAENLVGKYKSRIPVVGHIAMFMKSTPGLIVCVVVPVVFLIGYDIIRRRVYDKKNRTDTDVLLAELEKLKAEKAAEQAAEASEATAMPEAAEQTEKTETSEQVAEKAAETPEAVETATDEKTDK